MNICCKDGLLDCKLNTFNGRLFETRSLLHLGPSQKVMFHLELDRLQSIYMRLRLLDFLKFEVGCLFLSEQCIKLVCSMQYIFLEIENIRT